MMIDMLCEARAEIIFAFLAMMMALVIWRSLRKMHDASDVNFDLRDLLMEGGRVSKVSCVMMGAFAATTWQFVYFSLNGKMTEGYAGIYAAAWITPIVARMMARGEGTPGPTTVTTTTETTLKVPGENK